MEEQPALRAQRTPMPRRGRVPNIGRGIGLALLLAATPGLAQLSPVTLEPQDLAPLQAFVHDHRIVDDPDSLAELAYVVAGDDRRIISGAGDRVYARGELQHGEHYALYRVGERYVDAVSDEVLGLELIAIGQAQVEQSEGDIVALRVLSATQEVRNEDIVLPLEARESLGELVTRMPPPQISGTILGVPDGVRFIGSLQFVALDRGRRDGLEMGHVLEVAQQGEQVVDPRSGELLELPGNAAGLVLVAKTYPKMSYGLVMHATRSLAVGDTVQAPRGQPGVALQ